MKVVVACVGNIYRRDDGFGVAVAEQLADVDLGPDVRVIETGIGGIHLVQELYERADALIVVDAVDHGRPPGTVMVIEPEVIDVHELSDMARWDLLADMHYAKPERALMLAKALEVLPDELLMVGCQPVDAESQGRGLSEPVAAAVHVAVTEIQRIVAAYQDGSEVRS